MSEDEASVSGISGCEKLGAKINVGFKPRKCMRGTVLGANLRDIQNMGPGTLGQTHKYATGCCCLN